MKFLQEPTIRAQSEHNGLATEIDRGIDDLDAGRTVSREEFRKKFAEKLSEFEARSISTNSI